MAYEPDIAAVGPALELTLDHGKRKRRCAGTLDRRARHHLVAAVDELLRDAPSHITIDVARLTVADVEGADAFAHVQRMVRESGARLRWHGLDSEHLRGILPLRYRLRRPPHQLDEWTALRIAKLRHPSAASSPPA